MFLCLQGVGECSQNALLIVGRTTRFCFYRLGGVYKADGDRDRPRFLKLVSHFQSATCMAAQIQLGILLPLFAIIVIAGVSTQLYQLSRNLMRPLPQPERKYNFTTGGFFIGTDGSWISGSRMYP